MSTLATYLSRTLFDRMVSETNATVTTRQGFDYATAPNGIEFVTPVVWTDADWDAAFLAVTGREFVHEVTKYNPADEQPFDGPDVNYCTHHGRVCACDVAAINEQNGI